MSSHTPSSENLFPFLEDGCCCVESLSAMTRTAPAKETHLLKANNPNCGTNKLNITERRGSPGMLKTHLKVVASAFLVWSLAYVY